MYLCAYVRAYIGIRRRKRIGVSENQREREWCERKWLARQKHKMREICEREMGTLAVVSFYFLLKHSESLTVYLITRSGFSRGKNLRFFIIYTSALLPRTFVRSKVICLSGIKRWKTLLPEAARDYGTLSIQYTERNNQKKKKVV